MEPKKIAIIGDGAVGSSIAYTLVLSPGVSEIVLVDLNLDKAEGDVLDMADGQSFLTVPKKLKAGSYADVQGSHVVVITAGAAQKPGETRMDLLKKNAAIMDSVIAGLAPYLDQDTLLLIVSNPVDLLTYVAYKRSGLAASHVLGSGTVLDTARLKTAISEDAGVDPRSIHTLIVGEHGDSEVPVWSATTIGGIRLANYCQGCGQCQEGSPLRLEALHERVKNAAYRIIAKKGATNYAIALAVQRILSAILNDEKSVLPVSTLVPAGWKGQSHELYLSLPTIVGKDGAVRTLTPDYSEGEEKALLASAAGLAEKLLELSL